MSQSLQHQLAHLPLFRFALQTEPDLADALDAWRADDRIDDGRLHVLGWSHRQVAEREARA